MGDDSLILREDGYIRMIFPITSLTYHSNLNIILVKTDTGAIHVLDVNSGVILQSTRLSADDGGALGVEYVPGADRVFVWDSNGVGARNDYNGVLLLNTALQRPLVSAQPEKKIKVELVLSEAVLLLQCLENLDVLAVDGLPDFIQVLKTAIDSEPARKGVKAQKWSTVTIQLPQSTLRSVTSGVVQELKIHSRRIPALAIASAVGQQANDLVPCSREDESMLMYSEAERKETFKRWPHMDYKWALPARMAQAGFYHQPSPSGDDRAMCFICLVCLVSWEKSDEPWVEHERHSPNCPFVRGEYTHNVPISVTNATACAVPSPFVSVVSRGNTGDLIAAGTYEGKVNIWRFDCGLKLVKFIHMSPYDSIFSGILCSHINKVWTDCLEKDCYTYSLELTSMTFIGMTSQQETYKQPQNAEAMEKDNTSNKSKPSLMCGVIITRTSLEQDQPIQEEDSCSKALFNSGIDESKESVKAMNDQNEAKSNLTSSNKLLFLLTYDIHSSLAGSNTTVVHTSNSSANSKMGGSKKVCTIARSDDANIFDDIYLNYSDDGTELPCASLFEEQFNKELHLHASSSKDPKMYPKKMFFTKHFKDITQPPPVATTLLPEIPESGHCSMLDFVGNQLKSWTSGHLDSVGTKLVDQPDAAMLQTSESLTHYINMNGPLDISDLNWYEGGVSTDKMKFKTYISKIGPTPAVSNSNNDCFESEPPPEEVVVPAVAIQCLSLPNKLNLRDDSRITHLYPTEDKEHLLVVISSLPNKYVKPLNEAKEADTEKMEVDELQEAAATDDEDAGLLTDTKAYYLLYKLNTKTSVYTLEDDPVNFVELPYSESPVDLCLLPPGKQDEYSFAAIGIDGSLRLYLLPDFKVLSVKSVPQSPFTSVAYCASVERLSVATKHGMIYFYAFNNGEKDAAGDIEEDEFANIDFDMLQKASKDNALETNSTPPVILANKSELDLSDLETLISLTGSYGTNTTVPYSAVVPGFWCELSPAQRSRSDHQNNRTWRLQNTSSTWDEHVLELTLPFSVSLAHIEFAFTLHVPCITGRLPSIQVTLLKQNLHGIGYKKDASFGPINLDLENPVNSEEYLQAHNAEILAGPMKLTSGLDLTQESGTLILTSPRLYRAKGRTFLIHIKTLFDPAKDMTKGSIKSGESSAKKSGFIGCDWLHQISITVRSNPLTDVPLERQQRIAMLDSNSFLNTLLEIATSKDDLDKRKIAMDLIIWVITIRLQRLRLTKLDNVKEGSQETQNPIEAQQVECVKIIEKHVNDLIKNCILFANRSIAKKCAKIILITTEGVKQLAQPWQSTFDQTLLASISMYIPMLGACESPGAMRWLVSLTMHVTCADGAAEVVTKCLLLLQKLASALHSRNNIYHGLLRARFGLYGLPMEKSIFDMDGPVLGKSTATPVTYASVLTGDTSNPLPTPPKPDHQMKDLYNLAGDIDGKLASATVAWWSQSNGVGVFGTGLCESQPLHVTCHVASDGTKLQSSGARLNQAVGSSLCADPVQLWTAVKEGRTKQVSQDPDSLEDAENSSLMDCDPQDKTELPEDNLFMDQEQCAIPWSQLVTRPALHTLLVERMHSGARRFIVLDFGHAVRLTDIIIPSCSDLVTLCIDIWLQGEETDSVKLAFATDISTKHLVLSDMQPSPLCRYMKITTIGRYGMSAMKCMIPLGWFYGEIAQISNVPASITSLNVLLQDLTCKFRLANGKLMDLLNPYLDLYYGNAAHMMAYFNMSSDTDSKVLTAYQECLEIQQQLHTVTNILKKLQNQTSDKVSDLLEKGHVTPDMLVESASTDKLRVMCEHVVEMLLHFHFEMGETTGEDMTVEWCQSVSPLLWESAPRAAAALATLLPRLCGHMPWWGGHLADTLQMAFSLEDSNPMALDRCLVLVMYMCRASPLGVAPALAARALSLVGPPPQPALSTAVLAALAAAAAAAAGPQPSRWDWVTGGRVGSGAGGGSGAEVGGVSPRGSDCKLHRRKLHKKLLQQMQDLEAVRQSAHLALEQYQRGRTISLKTRLAMVGKPPNSASGSRPENETSNARTPRLVSGSLARTLAQALCTHMLSADATLHTDTLMLAAKVVGRLCVSSGGPGLLEPSSILGLARLATTLPPWPRHAITNLLQDLVEYERGDVPPPSQENTESWGPGGSTSRVINMSQDDNIAFAKAVRKTKVKHVTESLSDGFGMHKHKSNHSYNQPKLVAVGVAGMNSVVEYQLPLVVESDDSDGEYKVEQFIQDTLRKETKAKYTVENGNRVISLMGGLDGKISSCVDARFESCTQAASETQARVLLLTGSDALAMAIRAPPPPPPVEDSQPSPPEPRPAAPPPLTLTLYDVFSQLALEFQQQTDCSFMENVISLWLTLNGSPWGIGAGTGSWSLPGFVVPSDGPRVRLSSEAVNAILASIVQLDNISLRCWVLCLQALAWVANLPMQTEGSAQTMGRVILESEFFVEAIVKFVNMNVAADGAVFSSEPYLSGVSIGAGAGAASALHGLLSRVVAGRGAAGAGVALRCVCAAWQHRGTVSPAYDLHATLLRVAHPLLQLLDSTHQPHAVALVETIASLSGTWVTGSGGRAGALAVSWRAGEAASDARLSCLLADVLAGGSARRVPLRRTVLAQLMHYARSLLAVPLNAPQTTTSPRASGSEESQTDESKQQAQQQHSMNVEDERKQQAAREPCIADIIIQNSHIIHMFFKTLSKCEGKMAPLASSNTNSESSESTSLSEEVSLLVVHMIEVAAQPSLIVGTLLEYLKAESSVHLSLSLQQLVLRLLDKPDVLNVFIESGGLEISVEKLIAFHQSRPNTSPGLVSSLMNYLKLVPQLINLSTSSNNKKNAVLLESTNDLFNFAPLCTVSCGNPTAQAAEVLLGGGGGSSGVGSCAARRVRAAAWSYHFFSVDDASLALTLTLPYAIQLHEIHLQPHLNSLATCPGAVAIEAGCNGTLTPLGPPQNTSGMTAIRLVVSRPIVCTTVQIRLYKPRDSSNMGLLQIRLLGTPAFGKSPSNQFFTNTNNWAYVVSTCCTAGGLSDAHWRAVTSEACTRALAWLVAGAGRAGPHAHHALLAAATACPHVRPRLMHSLLELDAHSHAQAFQAPGGTRGNHSVNAICELLRQMCRRGGEGCVRAYLEWLVACGERYLHSRTPLSAAQVQTLAAVIWTMKEEDLLEGIEDMITDELFELMYTWLQYVPDNSMLKKALDAVLCSMCYIRLELFTQLLERMNIHLERSVSESMEGLTDDGKVHSCPTAAPPVPEPRILSLQPGQLISVANAAMSPGAIFTLLHSPLPAAVTRLVTEYSVMKLREVKEQCGDEPDIHVMETDSEKSGDNKASKEAMPNMKTICSLVEWMQLLCMDRKLKDWLGGPGATFWKPLLHLLCYPRHPDSTWQEGSDYAQLEECTIRLFGELTACHIENQKLFANTLHSILELLQHCDNVGMSGFTRALILRLVLSSERTRIAIRWAGGAPSGAPSPGSHPALHCHALLALPTHTTLRTLVWEKRPPLPLLLEENNKPSTGTGSGTSSSGVMRSASDTAIMTVAEAWELSMAAASASKDKRVKEAKNSCLKQTVKQKRPTKNNDTSSKSNEGDQPDSSIVVRVAGIEGNVAQSVTLGQLSATVPHIFGPHLSITLHLASSNSAESSTSTWEGGGVTESSGSALLREFGACGGLALVAARLPRPHAAAPPAPSNTHQHLDLEWVKMDEPYEEVVELGLPNGGDDIGNTASGGVPPHALLALGLMLKLPGYASALLDEGARAVHLLRLLLGVTHDEEGRSISVTGGSARAMSWSLGTLPFHVVFRLLESSSRDTDDGRLLRRLLLSLGAVRLMLTCLAVFTHHKPASSDNSQASNGSTLSKAEEKSQLYWAKGTGFGTGSTQQSWNVEQALVRQRIEEEQVTVLLQVLSSYMNPGEKWPPKEESPEEGDDTSSESERDASLEDCTDLPPEFIELIANSSLVPAICSYLRNDSVLDMSRHIPLYLCVLSCTRALLALRSPRLTAALAPLPRLLRQMSTTTNAYATKLKMNRKDVYNKLTFKKRWALQLELFEDDEGLASLIGDIQATSSLMSRWVGEEDAMNIVPRPMTAASREARYIEVMRRLQFESFEMIEECAENGFKFRVAYHYDSTVRAAGDRSQPARMKRLAQEAATLASSLPLSYSSSVFVRTDTDRLDVMKVLITGPSDTPYANGCFVLDVYFPADYPSVPMMINLETTGRHSVRFNPNLYNDGKVCLSVLNTWHGRPEEKWNAHTSSFLQVLVSIQSLILVPEPYFNEPGYERSRGSRTGNIASTEYNSNIYQANVRWAMLDHLRNPEPCFKEVIQTHFWIKRNEIMQTISGWITELESQNADERVQRNIQHNLMALKRHYVKIQEELGKLPVPPGLSDLDEPFQLPSAPAPAPVQPSHVPTPEDIDQHMEKIVSQVLE